MSPLISGASGTKVFVSAWGSLTPATILGAGCNSPPAVMAACSCLARERFGLMTGGQQIRCDSGADGTVRMKEKGVLKIPFAAGFRRSRPIVSMSRSP